MRNPISSLWSRRSGGVVIVMLLLALLTGAVNAQVPIGRHDASGPVVYPVTAMVELRSTDVGPEAVGEANPDLVEINSFTVYATLPLTTNTSETFWFVAKPIRSAVGEHADSLYQYGPMNWTISDITDAPANNRGNGIAIDQGFINPQTSWNNTDRAHAYWGYDDGDGALWYIDWPTIDGYLPNRTRDDYPSNWGVYTAAAAPGGDEVEVGTEFDVPSSWSAYLCPGANSGTADEYIGMSGLSTDPNYMETWLRSSSYTGAGTIYDVIVRPLLPCRQPAVSVTKTGTVTGITGNPGGPGTVKVKYCFTVTNATTPGSGVHLASYQVTDSSIGYNSGTVTYALAPGASAPQICAPDYTFNVTWPTSGNVCVTNSSGATATGTTPSGWGETTTGNPGAGFSTRTFTSPAATGGVGLQTCASPMAVTLAEFSAQQVGDHVLLTWETNSELNNRGFNLYRGTSPDEPDRQLNETLIPSQSQGSPGGFSYTWEDAADLVAGQTYFYWLDDVDMDDVVTRHGPVSVEFGGPTAVTLAHVNAAPVAAGAAALPWLTVALAAGAALALGRSRR